MRVQPTLSTKAIAENVGMSSRGVQKNIDALKKAGLVERVGAAKGGHWVVK
jgi:ATP-dependent DNA helicase RecG